LNKEETINYYRIAEAIEFLKENFRQQPSLEELSAKLHLSPFHFQRLFTEWAGVSPKKFIQFLTLDYAKSKIRKKEVSLFDAAMDSGLSGTGRLHDLFFKIEGMTPGEYKNEGANLSINYSFNETPFGLVTIASTNKGICHLSFSQDEGSGFEKLTTCFKAATFKNLSDNVQAEALKIFSPHLNPKEIKLHLKASPFQLKVWEALLKIPSASLSTYSTIAQTIQHHNAVRAVGTAIGQNPVAFVIPCHRVIQSSGGLGGYHWGLTRKQAMIGWEASRAVGME
jgi:AraC family transcriptional regulator of adaptative response/methylated-DNA-[protein]-cysteine methyltransferase